MSEEKNLRYMLLCATGEGDGLAEGEAVGFGEGEG
jgi:hypothetical protein